MKESKTPHRMPKPEFSPSIANQSLSTVFPSLLKKGWQSHPFAVDLAARDGILERMITQNGGQFFVYHQHTGGEADSDELIFVQAPDGTFSLDRICPERSNMGAMPLMSKIPTL